MKSKNIIVCVLVILASVASQAKSSVTVQFQLNSFTDYVEQEAGVYAGQTDNQSFSLKLSTIDETGKESKESFGPESIQAVSSDRIFIRDNKLISSSKSGVTVVQIKENTEKEIIISSEEMYRVLSESLKDKGQSLIKSFNLQLNEVNANYDLKISDLVCKKEASLICSISVEMLIHAEQ